MGYISPKAFDWECCYLWCVSMIQIISLSSWWKKFFISLVLSIILFVFVVAKFRLNFEKFSISPLQAYSFRCWFFQQPRCNLLRRVLPKLIYGRSWHFLLHSVIPMTYFYSSLRRHCDVALFSHLLELRIMFFSCLSI